MSVLTIRLIRSLKNGKEEILASLKSNDYGPDIVDRLINDCLDQAVGKLKSKNLASLRAGCPELSVLVSSGERTIRPSLHLSSTTLQRLAEAGVEFDFDPY